MKSTIFALRVKGTNKYMPARPQGSRGFSHDEPQPEGGDLGPRLFHSKKAAQNARVAWKRGVFEHYNSAPTFDDPYGETRLAAKEAPHRAAIELEVVEFELKEKK